MTTCTCVLSEPNVADVLCDYCSANLYAVRQDALTADIDERVEALEIADFVKQDYDLPDFDDFVKQDDLADAVADALKDSDVVEQATRGVTAGFTRALSGYATKADLEKLTQDLEQRLQADAPKRLAGTDRLTFRQRLTVLLTGRL